jgi:hypothetical protein
MKFPDEVRGDEKLEIGYSYALEVAKEAKKELNDRAFVAHVLAEEFEDSPGINALIIDKLFDKDIERRMERTE